MIIQTSNSTYQCCWKFPQAVNDIYCYFCFYKVHIRLLFVS